MANDDAKKVHSKNVYEQLLTRKQAARLLNVCPHTLMKWGLKGLIREIRPTRKCVRYSRADLDDFISSFSSKGAK